MGDFEPGRRAERGEEDPRVCLESGIRCASGAEARLLWKDAINPVTSVMKPRSASWPPEPPLEPLACERSLNWSPEVNTEPTHSASPVRKERVTQRCVGTDALRSFLFYKSLRRSRLKRDCVLLSQFPGALFDCIKYTGKEERVVIHGDVRGASLTLRLTFQIGFDDENTKRWDSFPPV